MSEILKELAVTLELTGTEISKGAVQVMERHLSSFSQEQVIHALRRCQKELNGRLTLASILERIDDGRPGPEEAWSMIPKDEHDSVVWTEEMRDAASAAIRLINDGDEIAARMAFLESYRRLLQESRADHIPVRWIFSAGWDSSGRIGVLSEAVELGRLSETQALNYSGAAYDEVKKTIDMSRGLTHVSNPIALPSKKVVEEITDETE